jgi:hypothetical protein
MPCRLQILLTIGKQLHKLARRMHCFRRRLLMDDMLRLPLLTRGIVAAHITCRCWSLPHGFLDRLCLDDTSMSDYGCLTPIGMSIRGRLFSLSILRSIYAAMDHWS